MTSKVSCHGCRTTITTKNHLCCGLCTRAYDLVCANVTEQRFLKSMSKDAKNSWKCPECVNKVPKAGNINTPVGVSHGSGSRDIHLQQSPTATQDDSDNITVHRGSRGPNVKRVLDHSYSEDTYCLDNIRTVIRDEMERVMDERLSVIITKLITEQILPVNKVIAELKDRVAALEDKLKASEMPPTKEYLTTSKPQSQNMLVENVISTNSCNINDIKQHAKSDPSRAVPKCVEPSDNIVSVTLAPGWKEVTKRRPRSVPTGVMRGAAAPGSMMLEAAERRRQLHIYYVKIGTTDAEVRNHLHSICDGDFCTVETLKARGNYASFKLDVPSKLADVIMSPENWTEDICVKPWRQSFRSKGKEDQQTKQ